MREELPLGTLMPIGRFSEMTRLSIKALRLYDEMKLLEPAQVDPSTGYRYYTPGQANRGEAIRRLRSLDMPLDDIREVLAAEPDVARKLLDEHRRRLEDELARGEAMLDFLSNIIEGKERLMPYEVSIKEIPDQSVAAIREHVSMGTIEEAIAAGFSGIVQALNSRGTDIAGTPFIIYHDVIDEETDGDIEMCIPVTDSIEDTGRVRRRTVAGGPVAATVHKGPYREIPPAYHALSTWIAQNGHTMTGPPREIYLNDPTVVGEQEALTEVNWPIDGEGT